MKKKILALIMISTMCSSLLMGCNNEKQEPLTNEIVNGETITQEPTTSPTPTEYIDYNNPLEVAGVDGMGVSNATIVPENDQFANKFSGVMDYSYETQNGATYSSRAYVSIINEYKSFMETKIELSNGNKYSFSWWGETSIGSNSNVTEDGTAIYLLNKDKTAILTTWKGSALKASEFEQYKNASLLKEDMPKLDKDSDVNEYWEEKIGENQIEYIYAINFSQDGVEYKGYKKFLLDKTKDKFVKFSYSQPIDNFDKEKALETISSIQLIDEDYSLLNEMETPIEIEQE